MPRKSLVIGASTIVAVVGALTLFFLAAIDRAHDSAKIVRCASNLKQLYTAMNLYEAQNDGWMMPALLNNENVRDGRWYGGTTLDAMFDFRQGGAGITPESDKAWHTMVFEGQIKKMLDCPAVNHPAGWGPTSEGGNGKWSLDYTYNQMLGSNSAAPGDPPVFEYPFVKHADVRRETLVATEVRDVTNVHDYVFNGLTPSLVPTSTSNTSDYQAIAGTPHQGGTTGNMLFADGVICAR